MPRPTRCSQTRRTRGRRSTSPGGSANRRGRAGWEKGDTTMPRIALDHGLKQLHADVLTLGSMVEKSIQRSVEALRTRDASVARRVIEDDARVNALRFQIEDRALVLIATQQPLVHDLRTIAAVLNIIT